MRLTRRDFSSCLIGAGLGSALPGAFAQAAPTEGVHYVRLAQPAPAPAGKIEVIEFFWYECPHCNALEPALDAWARRLPDDVAFRRVPVWFREEPFGPQQRLFYTLEALGLVPTLHRKVFQAIHGERTRLRTAEDMAAFALKNGARPDGVHDHLQLVRRADEGAAGAPDRIGLQDRRRAGDGRPGPLLHQRHPRQRRRCRRDRSTACWVSSTRSSARFGRAAGPRSASLGTGEVPPAE